MEQIRLLSVRDVCESLNIGKSLLRRMLVSGEIESVRIGDRRLIPADALSAYIESLRTGTADAS